MPTSFIKKNEFSRNVLTLMSGTVIAQAIPIAIIPILTRIFTPEDFGLLALYVAFVSVLGVVSTGRYEIAVMLPDKDEDAKILLQISVFVALIFSTLILIPVMLWGKNIGVFLGNHDIVPWLYLLPASVFLTGAYHALTYWNNRSKRFKNTAISRVSQSLSQGSSQIGFGLFKISGGLIMGQFIGILSSTLFLLNKNNAHGVVFDKYELAKMRKQATNYSDFPKYSVFGALCDSGAVQMPILILSKFYSASTTGMFSLTFRILNMPSSIISAAISQVLFQKVVSISNNNPNQLSNYLIKIFVFLFLIYLPVVPILLTWGDSLFAFIFGEQWREAGVYAGYLAIAVAVRFAVSPLSSVLGLKKNIKKGASWQVLYFITISSTLLFFSRFPIDVFITAFVVHELILYLSYFLLILQSSRIVNKVKA